MAPEIIIEGNNLIEEFVGIREPVKDANDFTYAWRSSGGYMINYTELEYHQHWGLLMAVVEKIESLKFQFADYNAPHSCNVRISQGYVEIEGTTGQKTFRNTSLVGSKIYALWLAIVDFIKWYNENQRNNLSL